MKRLCSEFLLKYSKTVDTRTEFDDITLVALIYQRIFGQQVLDPEWTWKKFITHQILSLVLFIYIFFGTLQCLRTTSDIEIIAEAYYTFIMLGIFPIKMLLFINNRFLFRKLYVNIKTTLITTIKNGPGVDINDVLKTGKKIVYTLFVMVLVPCSTLELTTLWNYISGQRTLLSRSTETLLPMTSPYYEITWIIHTIFLLEVSSTIILDMWFVLLVYILGQSIDALVNSLKIHPPGNSALYSKQLNEKLRQFYTIHVEQVKYMNVLSRMYKWLAFVPLCNAAMCTCLILLLMSEEVNWKFAPHMLPMFAEIFAYNWFGEQIKTKATNLHMALINFNWNDLEIVDRQNYYIILTYMNKDFGLKTAIGNLSLVTMTSVLKMSYQAFTVLRTYNN